MEELQKRVQKALEVIDPTNTSATLEEKSKAFLIIKEALNLLYE